MVNDNNNRHGVRQLQSGWSDGPSYITQCPIQTGQSYVYNFTIVGQRGTLFWHAHFSWLRATVYGPLILLPRHNESYPFKKPYKEVPILFGTCHNHQHFINLIFIIFFCYLIKKKFFYYFYFFF